MPGTNVSLAIPPGINSDVSRYMAKQSWWAGNLIRWNDDGVLQPVGGWQKLYTLLGLVEPVREIFSWADNNSNYFVAFGSLTKVIIRNVNNGETYDATPEPFNPVPSGMPGFGSGSFGVGRFGLDTSNNSQGGVDNKFSPGYWTFSSWGQNLIGVHSVDGRLYQWDPTTPSTRMVAVANAPLSKRLCITTDERHAMLLGGPGSPRRVDWCSREDITDWSASATDSAGGWELDTNGIILSAIKVPQGILVATDIDIHLIEYVGPPQYYSRRLISTETGIASPKGMCAIPNGAIVVGTNAFWAFNGGLSKIPCTVSDEVFIHGNLDKPLGCFIGANEFTQEAWFFYPKKGDSEASKCVIFKYSGGGWWSKANLVRTAWANPVWTSRPIAVNFDAVYEHERGWTDDGYPRDVYAETGAFEIGNGERNMSVSKIFHDTVFPEGYIQGDSIPYRVEFKLARAPQGAETVYGPVTLNAKAGYTTLRFKSRQVAMKVQETISGDWGLGNTRLSVKSAGTR